MLARCLVAVLDRLLLYIVWSVCVAPLLRFEHALYETCLVLHVVSYYHVASLFWGVCLMFGCILHQCHVYLVLLIFFWCCVQVCFNQLAISSFNCILIPSSIFVLFLFFPVSHSPSSVNFEFLRWLLQDSFCCDHIN